MMHLIQGDAAHVPLADQSVDLVFTSPPYGLQRTYGISAQRGIFAWVDWMVPCIKELCRVCRGLVMINCGGWSTKRVYQPGPEMLLTECFRAGISCWRPAYWNRVGIPGSGGKHWLRADVEYVLCFKADSEWPAFSDNTANGHAPKWGIGGEMSYRHQDGRRRNARTDNCNPNIAQKNLWGHSYDTGGTAGVIDDATCAGPRPSHRRGAWGGGGTSFGRRANGTPKPPSAAMRATRGTSASGEKLPNRETAFPVKANPGNLVKVIVGGGVMGSKLCHENEAPFPEKLAEWFIKGWAAPGGIVLDPFSGSGTTAKVAHRLGRIGIGMDLRWNQCELGVRRRAEPERAEKKPKRAVVAIDHPLLFAGSGAE